MAYAESRRSNVRRCLRRTSACAAGLSRFGFVVSHSSVALGHGRELCNHASGRPPILSAVRPRTVGFRPANVYSTWSA